MASLKKITHLTSLFAVASLLLLGCAKEETTKSKEDWRQKYEAVKRKYSNLTQKQQLEALQKDWQYIHFIQNPSQKVQLAALKIEPEAIAEIQNPSLKAQLYAIERLIDKEGGFSMTLARVIDKFDPKAQAIAVSRSPFLIKYIPYPTLEVQLAAIEANPWVARSINKLEPKAKAKALKLEPKLQGRL